MRKIAIFLVLGLLCLGIKSTFAQQASRIDLNSLIQETQQKSDQAGEMTFVWWIPEEYWQISFAQNPTMNQAQIEEFISVFKPYTLIAVVDGKVGTFGTVTYKTEAEVRNLVRLKDSQGNIYSPLEESGINVATKSFLSMMKPMWANVLGPMGQNMYFFLFPAKDKDGQNICEAKKEGQFSVVLGEREFRWKLPLKSLLPVKVCPVCKERLDGSYKFCPWDGTKLE